MPFTKFNYKYQKVIWIISCSKGKKTDLYPDPDVLVVLELLDDGVVDGAVLHPTLVAQPRQGPATAGPAKPGTNMKGAAINTSISGYVHGFRISLLFL